MKRLAIVRQAGVLHAACCVLAALLLGCSSSSQVAVADLGELKGTVTHTGKPVVHGAVQFFKGETLVCVATIETDGSYRTLIVPGEYKVAIVTQIEPREAAKLAREGPPELVGTVEGGAPVRPPLGGEPEVKEPGGEYDRLPTLAAVLAKLTPAERATLDAVQSRYGKADKSGLSVTVEKGLNPHDFQLQ